MLFILLLPALLSQDVSDAQLAKTTFVEVAANDSFHRSVLTTARKRMLAGELPRRDMIRLRVAMLSPAFRRHAEDLAIIQIASSSDDLFGIPTDDDGVIIRAKIDWDSLADFIERLIPLILMLIQAITGGG